VAQRTELEDLRKQVKESQTKQSALQASVSEQLGFREALEKTWENQKNVITDTNKIVILDLYKKIKILETDLEKRKIKPIEE